MAAKVSPAKRVRDALGNVAAFFASSAGEGKVSKLQGWIDEVAVKNPAKAAELTLQLLEYTIPKQARIENVGDEGGPLSVIIRTTPPVCTHCHVRHDPSSAHAAPPIEGGTLQ